VSEEERRRREKEELANTIEFVYPEKPMFSGPVILRELPPTNVIKKIQSVYEKGLKIHVEKESIYQPVSWKGSSMPKRRKFI
jgi:hypothetical protein